MKIRTNVSQTRRNTVLLVVFGMVLVLSVFAAAQQAAVSAETWQKADALLTKIETYDFGMSRESLTDFVDLERSMYGSPLLLAQLERKILAVLKNKSTTFAGKQFLCQRLSIMGTSASVPVLANLLNDAKTADLARYALERIPESEVDRALLKSLKKTQDLTKIGIINTLGQRQVASAVKDLRQLLSDRDSRIAAAAASALGMIGDDKAIAALDQAMTKTGNGDVKLALYDAYLKSTDKLVAQGKNTTALAMYQKMSAPDLPAAIKIAALAGVVRVDAANAEKTLLANIKGDDPALQSAAIAMLRQLPGKKVPTNAVQMLPQLSALHKVQMLAAWDDLGDRTVLSAVVQATTDADENVRIAALKSLAKLGDANSVTLLAKTAATASGPEKQAAQSSLYLLPGEPVDAKIIALIPGAEPKEKVELITAVAERDTKGAVPTLLQATKDQDGRARLAAIKVLGSVATPSDLGSVIDVLVDTQTEAEQGEAVSSVALIAKKITEPGKQSELVLAKLSQVKDVNAKVGLLRALGRIGESEALPTLRESLSNKNEDLQVAAIRALSDWPPPAVTQDLLDLAQKSTNKRNQILALRGFIGQVRGNTELADEDKITQYRKAMDLATELNEKRMVISGIGELKSAPALQVAVDLLANPDLQAEAEAAVLQISRTVRRDNPEAVKKAFTAVVAVTQNEETRKNLQKELEALK